MKIFRSYFLLLLVVPGVFFLLCCNTNREKQQPSAPDALAAIQVDTNLIPHDRFGDAVRYGRALMLNTAYYIGPEGSHGRYLGNRMNCTNCHQDAGTKPFSFNLLGAHDNYPQYRAREGKILTLAERVNNCVMRPHNGRPLPLDGPEMIALLSYFKWINSFVPKGKPFEGAKNLPVQFPPIAASPERGAPLFEQHCARCHGTNGEGQLKEDRLTYLYPPLWGSSGYQAGSSMHRIIKQAQWLKSNMPYDKVLPGKPFLSDEQALDIAAYINNDQLHPRPDPKSFDYPHIEEKALDYDRGPFADTFSVANHKYGPYKPIIDYWKKKGVKPAY